MPKQSNPQADAVAHRAKVAADQVREFYDREANQKPTPTQLENDMAAVGAPVAELEDHGAEPEEVGVQRVLDARNPANNPYNTRELDAGRAPSPQVPRDTKAAKTDK